jgi:hypothetical protein
MPFINTEGLTIIGDGSQWFWAMAGFLALPITGYAIYSQLRAQRSANRVNAMAALVDKWESDRMVRHRLAVLMDIAEGRPGWPPALFDIGMFFDRIALLVKHGDVNVTNVWEEWSFAVQVWWLRNAAAIAEERRTSGPLLWADWEHLAHAMEDLDRRHDRLSVFDEGTLGHLLSASISDLIERLRLEQEAKSGTIPTWPPAQAAQETKA